MKIKLEAELADALYYGESDDCYKFITNEYWGTWRWGVSYRLVIQDLATGKYFAAIRQEQIGDHYWNSFVGDGFGSSSPIEFTEVEPVRITLTKYKEVSNAQ